MREALTEARKGIGLTSPNPPVGAVVVKEGRELGRGWHEKAGGPHAERVAIHAAKQAHGPDCISGSTVYVSLEPCSTRGRTGACTDLLIAEGVRRVVWGADDPNPAHAGRAGEILRTNRIETAGGIEEPASCALIAPFAKVQRTGLPWVMVKTAMSLDGRITRPPGEGQWLSSEASRQDVQHLRGEVEAILTTGQTVRMDNPQLTLRGPGLRPGKDQPWRVVLASRDTALPPDCHLFADQHRDRTLFRPGVRIEQVLRELVVDKGVTSVLVEAGGRLCGRLVDEGWADEVVVYLAPLITGGEVPALGGEGASTLAERWRLEPVTFKKIGNDVRLRGLLAGRGGVLER